MIVIMRYVTIIDKRQLLRVVGSENVTLICCIYIYYNFNITIAMFLNILKLT